MVLYMSSIIHQIIEIDSIAQQKLNDASMIKENVKKEVIEKTEQTKKLVTEKMDARIQKIRDVECGFAQEQKDKIKTENDMLISKLMDTYSEVHEQLEQEIFLRVIS